jgi:hypothetical protein
VQIGARFKRQSVPFAHDVLQWFAPRALLTGRIMRSLLIIALSAALAFTCHRLAEIENQRYALLLGMCHQQDSATPYDFECLEEVETRTSWIEHLYFGLFGPVP